MKKNVIKKIIVPFVFLFIITSIHANTVSFKSDYFTGKVSYNEKGKPGEAIFARLSIKILKNAKRKSNSEPEANMLLYKDSKKVDSSSFYFTSPKSKKLNNLEYVAGIPLTLWSNGGEEYSIKIVFYNGIQNETVQEITLPFTLETIEWNRETLDLDEKNSNIKQDMSEERLKQIEKLNAILKTVTPSNVYSFKPFIMPVNTTRQTAYCGDRRIYAYTNGKSSTSLHYGNDYGVPEGTEVSSCSDGRVVLAEFRISTGWSVVIEHLPGLYSLYYHMSSLNVKEGEYVRQGEKIGYSGSTGLATGPHLHWEVRLNMQAVQPHFFMKDFTFQNESHL